MRSNADGDAMKLAQLLGMLVLCGLLLGSAGLTQGHAGQGAWGSQPESRPNRVLARLSYDSTYPTEENSFRPPLACFELQQWALSSVPAGKKWSGETWRKVQTIAP